MREVSITWWGESSGGTHDVSADVVGQDANFQAHSDLVG